MDITTNPLAAQPQAALALPSTTQLLSFATLFPEVPDATLTWADLHLAILATLQNSPVVWLMFDKGSANPSPTDVEYVGFFGPLAQGKTLVALGLQNHLVPINPKLVQGGPVQLSDGSTWTEGVQQTLPASDAPATLVWQSRNQLAILRADYPVFRGNRTFSTVRSCPPEPTAGGYRRA